MGDKIYYNFYDMNNYQKQRKIKREDFIEGVAEFLTVALLVFVILYQL